MNINTESQLQSLIGKAIEEAMQVASNYIQDNLAINIYNGIYIKPPSKYYKRTPDRQMLKAIFRPKVKVSGGKFEVDIGIDTEVVKHVWDRGVKMFNSHMNQDGTGAFKSDPYTWNGTPVTKAVFMFYDEGTSQPVGYKFPSIQATNFWHDVMGARLSEDNPDYDKAYKVFEEEFYKNLAQFGQVTVTRGGG
jgi:hypothetical protein